MQIMFIFDRKKHIKIISESINLNETKISMRLHLHFQAADLVKIKISNIIISWNQLNLHF